jgi:hypothetical protein
MPKLFGKKMGCDRSGKVQLFSIIIILMLVVCAYELSIIYSDWKMIKKMPFKIGIVNDQHAPVAEVSISLNGSFIGQTNAKGEITTLIPKAGDFRITASKKPLVDIDTTVTVSESGLNAIFAMTRPFSSLTLFVGENSGKPLSGVSVLLNNKDYGRTGSDGSLLVDNVFRLNDNVQVKLSKDGFNDLAAGADLTSLAQADSFTMVAKTVEKKPKPQVKPPPPKPEFQSHFDLANRYLDRAISGESKYFGSSLREIDQAIRARPGYLPAKQLKVEILYNFAKSLKDAGLMYEAANRCGEALKIYNSIPQDQMYEEVNKLKAEVDRNLK